jgi:hypothetical protein
MTDINYLSTIALGKINRWDDSKTSGISPITFPGEDAGLTEGIDTLGIASYTNIEGVITGTFKDIQITLRLIKSIADGNQTSGTPLRSPFVNSRDLNDDIKQGNIGMNVGSGTTLTDSNAFFQSWGITTSDKVKNLITGEVSAITSVDSENQLTLTSNIFASTNLVYAVTATIVVKVLSFEPRWELPALNYCTYTLSVMQVAS